jgi:hypothetical protein
MIRIFLISLLYSFLYVPVASLAASQETELATPVQVVAAFQKLPHYEMLCLDNTWRNMSPIKIGAELESYLSKNLHKLFMWEECNVPEIPPHDETSRTGITWDIRFGLNEALSYANTFKAGNVRVQSATNQGSSKAIVKVLFDPTSYNLKNITTTYTLIREDGHWKIDDIAPKGDFKKGDEDYDAVLEHSDSIKTDMQNNYRAAEERYQQEQAKKGSVSTSKP